MADPAADELAVVAAFLVRYHEDHVHGRLRPLEEYQALYPGHEKAIAREHAALLSAEEPAAPLAPIGPYRLLRELGRGGQGEVFLAEDTRLRRRVALKTLRGLGLDEPEALARFRREAEVASRLDHPGICTVYEAGFDRGIPWIAMRYVEGESLARRIAAARERKAGRRDPTTASGTTVGPGTRAEAMAVVRIVEDAARAIHAAHEAGIVHRDLKPANIVVTPEGRPVVLDFGLAREVEGGAAPTLTRTGDLFGTPAYMAPEQIDPKRGRVDRRTDVYALGVTLYECLTLQRPFEAATREALYRAILSEEPLRPRRLNAAVPGDLAVVVEVALERDRDRRYQTALDLAEDLRRVREREPVRARPAGPLLRFRRWVQREPARASLAGLLLVVACVGGYGAAEWPQIRADRRAALERARSDALERKLEEAFLHLEEPDRAERDFADALALDPRSPEAAAGSVMVHIARRDGPGALVALERQRALGVELVVFQHLRLDALIACKREAEAKELMKTLPPPQTALDHFLFGSRELTAGDATGDAKAFARALRLLSGAIVRSSSPRALYFVERAHAAGHCGDAEAARETAEVLESRWPGSPAAWFAIGMAFQQIDPDRAGAAWRKTLELRPGQSRAHVNLGMTFKRKGQLDEAMDSFRQAVACEPGNAHAHYNLAVMLNQKGLRREAIEAYRMSVKHDPRNGKAWNNLGNALGREGLFEEALEARQRAVEWMPREGTVHYNLGNALVPLARDAEAAVAFAKAVELEPKDAEARCNLGHALRRLGRFRESREAVEAGHRAGSAMPGWRYPSERWVKRARALEAAEGQLDAVRRGEREPEGAAEAGALAEVALWKGLPWTAARLYAAALAEPSERPEHAAFLPLAAGRVACGAGTGESPAPEADERTRWLDQAIGWMEVGLEAEDRLDAEALGRWKHDPGLACLRDAEARARLPEDQRRRVEAVWAAVERRLKTP